jgi:ankyrin repeat protein
MTFEAVIAKFSRRGLRTSDIQSYLDAGGDIDCHDENLGYTLLHFAAENREVDTIRFLASRNADLHARDRNGWTPLHTAADADLDTSPRDGRVATTLPTVKALLELGADQSLQGSDGKTARDIARDYKQESLFDAISRSTCGS